MGDIVELKVGVMVGEEVRVEVAEKVGVMVEE